MPLLILHGTRPPVAVANKTPSHPVIPQAKQASEEEDTLGMILNKLKNIEAELGIVPAPEQDPVEREAVIRRMELARAAKDEKKRIAEEEKKAFVKRMRKGKAKAARRREKEA